MKRWYLATYAVLTLGVLSAQEVHVTSNEMQAFDAKHEIHFIGDANVTQEKNWIHADRIVVYLTSDNKAKRYVAKGKVTFFMDEKSGSYRGKSDTAVYEPERSNYILSGHAFVRDLRNRRTLKGEKITINTVSGKADVRGTKHGKRKKPVTFTFESGKSKKGKQ